MHHESWPSGAPQPSRKPTSPREGPHRSATKSTRPGPVESSVRSSRQACSVPSATTSTRPSARLLAVPDRPSSSARARVHQRKPTPWTWPFTNAVRRTVSTGTRLETCSPFIRAASCAIGCPLRPRPTPLSSPAPDVAASGPAARRGPQAKRTAPCPSVSTRSVSAGPRPSFSGDVAGAADSAGRSRTTGSSRLRGGSASRIGRRALLRVRRRAATVRISR